MALAPDQMREAILRNLKAKTGKSIEEWIEFLQKTKLEEKNELTLFLKKEQNVGHFQAQIIVEQYANEHKI